MELNEYMVDKDLRMIRELREFSQEDMAKELDISRASLIRWENNDVKIPEANIEKIYAYAYKHRIMVNKIKEQLYREDYVKNGRIILFHGAKSIIEGSIDMNKSKEYNDFGKGFYCGENLEQSAMFVSSYPKASVYILNFDCDNLNCIKYDVNQEWMLTIAYFRGRLDEYKEHIRIKELIKKLENIDYIIAPIADNRMFQIIDSFIEGEITDEQCQHCLSATNLGFQYVLKSEKAIEGMKLLERCYLCQDEKLGYAKRRNEDSRISEDKVKVARKKYRGKGLYIDEILK